MISICPKCRGELERQENYRTEELQGEYHPVEAEIVEWIWICDACLLWWRTTPREPEELEEAA